jgi:uncharacterized membrane protein YhaH (DUF805 family)
MEETKKCPYCGSEIDASARKCRYCGEWVDKDSDNQPPTPPQDKKEPEPDNNPYGDLSDDSSYWSCFCEYADKWSFSGTMTRSMYWKYVLFAGLTIAIIQSFIIMISCYFTNDTITIYWFLRATIVCYFPLIAATARRLNDLKLSRWWILAYIFIPIIGQILWLCHTVKKGYTKSNDVWKSRDSIILGIYVIVYIVVTFYMFSALFEKISDEIRKEDYMEDLYDGGLYDDEDSSDDDVYIEEDDDTIDEDEDEAFVRPANVLNYSVGGVNFEMVEVEGGKFNMGGSDSEAYNDEKPVHSEYVSSFKIGKTEVAQALWKAVMGNNPSTFKGDDLPVEMVSWNDCKEFIRKLNSMTGKNFRLPTEAEWEYAARGGNKSRGYKYSGSNNIGEVAWYTNNSSNTTHAVATKAPNELGIYDMSGNVWEWTSDLWCDNYNVARGGSNRVYHGGGWSIVAKSCRVSCRNSRTPEYKRKDIGLRLAI